MPGQIDYPLPPCEETSELTYAVFVTKFPEFGDIDPDTVNQEIEQVTIEVCGYEGITNDSSRQQALALAVAHALTLQLRAENPMGTIGAVKSLKSRNDQIQYAIKDLDPYDLNSTRYGVRLQGILNQNYLGGFLA